MRSPLFSNAVTVCLVICPFFDSGRFSRFS